MSALSHGMRLFRIESTRRDIGRRLRRRWMVIAPDPDRARALVPSGFEIGEVVPLSISASGPSRIIGWAGEPLLG